MSKKSKSQFGIIADRGMNELLKKKITIPFPDILRHVIRFLTIEDITKIINKYRPTLGDFEIAPATDIMFRIEYLKKGDKIPTDMEHVKILLAFEFYDKIFEDDISDFLKNLSEKGEPINKLTEKYGAKDTNELIYILKMEKIEEYGYLLIKILSKSIEFVKEGKVKPTQKSTESEVGLPIDNSSLYEFKKSLSLDEINNIKAKCLEYLEMTKNR